MSSANYKLSIVFTLEGENARDVIMDRTTLVGPNVNIWAGTVPDGTIEFYNVPQLWTQGKSLSEEILQSNGMTFCSPPLAMTQLCSTPYLLTTIYILIPTTEEVEEIPRSRLLERTINCQTSISFCSHLRYRSPGTVYGQ